MEIIKNIIYIIFGLILLAKSADFFVSGAADTAKKLGISQLVIGLTVVAIGTSLPELFINIKSALAGSTDIALGNILGSNIANILLILGCSLIFAGNIYTSKEIQNNIYISIGFTLLLGILGLGVFDNMIGTGLASGVILVFMIIVYGLYILHNSKKESTIQEQKSQSNIINIIYIIGGIIGLMIGGNITVEGAVSISKYIGISEKIIGLTVIAIGTSLPELITSIVAVKKGNSEIAIGNVIGSNISNIGLVLGITSIIKPINFYDGAYIDIAVIIGASILLLILSYGSGKISKIHGYIFVAVYLIYILFQMGVLYLG